MTPFVHVAGWTLVHFVWQGALAGLVAAVALRLLRSASAQTRYAVACGALAAMLAAPIVTARLLSASDPAGAPLGPLPAMPAHGAVAGAPARLASASASRYDASIRAARGGLDTVLPLVVIAWFAGVACLLLRLAGGWWRVRRLHLDALARASSRWQAVSERIALRLHLHRRVHVVDSLRVDTPTVLGWLRPVILLPIAALANLAPGQVEAILSHELAHVRRHDYVVNLLQTLAETLLFYHPAVWWVSSRIRAERENCCDDVAVRVCGDAVDYAAALSELETWRTTRATFALAATDGSLLARVRRLLLGRVNDDWRSSAATVTATVAMIALILVGATARAARLQSFMPGDSSAIDLAGDWQGLLQLPANGQTLRIVLKITKTDAGSLQGLIYSIDQLPQGSPVNAISMQGTTVKFAVPGQNETYQGTLGANGSSIAGWLTQGAARPLNLVRATTETAWEIPAPPAPIAAGAPLAFDVASIKPTAPGAQSKFLGFRGRTFTTINLSLSNLLSLGYDVHERQIVNAPAWAESETFDISATPESAGQPTLPQGLVMLQALMADRFKLTFHREKRELPVYALTVTGDGPKLTKNDGSPNGRSGLRFQGLGTLPGTNATMAEFAQVMQGVMDRPIIDRTGLNGRWDFLLKWTPDQSQFGGRAPAPVDDPSAPPTLFTAIQEQLGLRLESTRAQVDVIVIDTVDHPTPN